MTARTETTHSNIAAPAAAQTKKSHWTLVVVLALAFTILWRTRRPYPGMRR